MRQMLTISLLLLACGVWGQTSPKDPHRDSVIAAAVINKLKPVKIDSCHVVYTEMLTGKELMSIIKRASDLTQQELDTMILLLPTADDIAKENYAASVVLTRVLSDSVSDEAIGYVFLDMDFNVPFMRLQQWQRIIKQEHPAGSYLGEPTR